MAENTQSCVDRLGKEKLAKDADLTRSTRCMPTILKDGWDGEWFLRAYDAFSLRKIGSKECEEGQIFIEPQGFCVLAGVGIAEGLAERALKSVEERLDTKYGIMILQPAYTHVLSESRRNLLLSARI